MLVAALLESHPLHERTGPWTRAVINGEIEAFLNWPTVLEVWSALVEFRDVDAKPANDAENEPPVSTPDAKSAAAMVEGLLDRFEAVEITGGVYRRALRRCAEQELTPEALDAALHLITAEIQGVDGFVTFRAHRFERLSREGSPKILTPPDPPFLCL